MNIFVENKSSKIALNSFVREMSEYHTAVISILSEKNAVRLFHSGVTECLNLCRASSGVYCSYKEKQIFKIEHVKNFKFKAGKHIIVSSEIINSLNNGQRAILTDIEEFDFIEKESMRDSGIKSVLISGIYYRKKIVGALILFDNKRSHKFNDLDCHKILIFSLDNLNTIRSNKIKAQTDSLTGLLNHKVFVNKVDYEIKRSLRYGRSLSISMFDIDNFKQINDRYGHLAGDKILIVLSEICKKLFRTVDYCARYGGDEFAVLLTETSIDAAKEVLTRLSNTVLTKDVHYQSSKIRFSISIGIATLDSECVTAEKLIERADAAMYDAKQSSDLQIVLWENSLFI
jgi:diguanylate cyclase (GGDEF)-like protein